MGFFFFLNTCGNFFRSPPLYGCSDGTNVYIIRYTKNRFVKHVGIKQVGRIGRRCAYGNAGFYS